MLITNFFESIKRNSGYQFPTQSNDTVRDIIINHIVNKNLILRPSRLVVYSKGQDYTLPEGITVDELNVYAESYHSREKDEDFLAVLQGIGEMNSITLQNSFQLQGVASCIKYEDIISVFPIV